MVGESSLSKLRTVCRYGYLIILLVVAGLVFVAALNLINLGLCLTDPDHMLPSMDRYQTYTSSVSYFLTSAFMAVGCAIAARVTKSMSVDDSPFNDLNVRRMRRITLIALLGFLCVIAGEFITLLLIRSPEIWIEIPFELIVIAGLTYIFSLLFEYGTVLQKESDHFL